MTSSTVPAFYFQIFQVEYEGTFVWVLIDIFTSKAYLLHFIIPLVLGWIFWHTLNERRTFYLFVYTFTTLSLMALITFMIFPSAPPWYVFFHGFKQPSLEFYDSSALLINFDLIIGVFYVGAAYFIAKKLILPYIFDRFIDYNLSTKILSCSKSIKDPSVGAQS
jgi:hypothetical protein